MQSMPGALHMLIVGTPERDAGLCVTGGVLGQEAGPIELYAAGIQTEIL